MDEELTGAEQMLLQRNITKMESSLGRKLGPQEIEHVKINLELIQMRDSAKESANTLKTKVNLGQDIGETELANKFKKPLDVLQKARVGGNKPREGD